jgi:hypothetical protein
VLGEQHEQPHSTQHATPIPHHPPGSASSLSFAPPPYARTNSRGGRGRVVRPDPHGERIELERDGERIELEREREGEDDTHRGGATADAGGGNGRLGRRRHEWRQREESVGVAKGEESVADQVVLIYWGIE